MAAPSYGKDLVDISLADEAAGVWAEPTATGWTALNVTNFQETDFPLQGASTLYCMSGTVKTGVGGLLADSGASGITIPTDGAILVWCWFGLLGALDTAGAFRVCVGSALNQFYANSPIQKADYALGGWRNLAVAVVDTGAITMNVVAAAGTFTRTAGDFLANGFAPGQPVTFSGFTNGGNNVTKIISAVTATVITVTDITGLVNESGNADERAVMADYLGGTTPSTTRRYIGWCYGATFATTPRGAPYGVDAMRYGRCEARFSGGDTGGVYCTFSGFATQDGATANKWGLVQAVSGGYLWKGLMTLGYGSPSAIVDFRDANTMVLVEDTRRVTPNFNKIEIRNASSRVDWTNISFKALGTLSKGRLEVIDDCDVNISLCTFSGMDTFIFKAASEVLNSRFIGCGTVTAGGASFAGTAFSGYEGAADSSLLLWETAGDPDTKLTGCAFTKGTAATHAIRIGTGGPTTLTFRNITFTGYNAADGQNDSAVYFAKTTGDIYVSVVGCSGFKYKSAGATIHVTLDQKTLTLTGLQTGSDIVILTAGTTTERVNVDANPTTTYGFPYTYAADDYVDICVYKHGYVPWVSRNYHLLNADGSLPVSQIVDRNYSDPA